MRNLMLKVRAIMVLVALWVTAGAAMAADVNLTPFVGFTFNNPVGIDFHEPAGKLIMSVNWPTGLPHNLDLVDAISATPFANAPTSGPPMVGFLDELKIASVRAGSCQGGFAFGEIFTANGIPGQVVRISADGLTVQSPWVSLGGTDLLRGSFFQDRFCAAGGDLIVVTSNEQPEVSVGNVYRITSAGVATLVGTTNTHLEGVTTVSNIPAVYGPMAGRILVGAEELANDLAGYIVPNRGRIYVFNPNPPFDFFTIGAGTGPTCLPASPPLVNGCNFPTATEFHPEDLDVIRKNADFFGVDVGAGRVLQALSTDQTADNFRSRCGQVLITQELLTPTGTSGLYALRWDPGTSSFIVDLLTAIGTPVGHWEHVTFTSGTDCNTNLVNVKTPDNGTFNIGDQLTFTQVVTNNGPFVALAAELDDPLPTTGGLTWSVFSVSAGTCDPIPVSQILHCDLGDIPVGGSVTVVVKSSNVGGAPAGSCTGQKLDNIGTVLATNADPMSDHGDYICGLNLRTVTQGGWGSPPHGNNPGSILKNNFAQIGPVVIGCTTGFTDAFTTALAIEAFLPAGGKPAVLNVSATNPLTTSAGVFAGQVLALEISVSFSDAGVLPAGLGGFTLTTGPAAGKTVNQVLADANNALGGCGLPSYVTKISELNDIVTSINEMFD